MIGKRLCCIRGATCSKNNKEDIIKNIEALFRILIAENSLRTEDFVSIQFTMTDDLDTFNAAAALRRSDIGIDVSSVPLFCSQEPKIKNMLPFVIRTMLTVYMDEGRAVHHAYMNGAECLRPDLATASVQ